jgi:hypothetical protein
MEILLWIFMAYGMSNILVYGSIFNGIREFLRKWGEDESVPLNSLASFISSLLSCMMCTSTWVGFFMSLVAYSPWHEIIGLNQYASIFFDGMLASGAVWAINSVIEWFEENRPNKS